MRVLLFERRRRREGRGKKDTNKKFIGRKGIFVGRYSRKRFRIRVENKILRGNALLFPLLFFPFNFLYD